MPIIIVEGIDGSGKSTLANMIQEVAANKYDVIRDHRGPMKGSVVEEYVLPLFKIKPNELLIADRWHVGEMIYGPIYRGISYVDSVLEHIENILDDLAAVKIVMLTPREIVKERLELRGEEFLKKKDFDQVYDFYEKFASDYFWEEIREVNEFTPYQIMGMLEREIRGNVE
jgi:thymidylate kinase